LTWYARDLGAVHSGEIKALRKAEERLKELREKASNAGNDDMATYIEISRRVLAGRMAQAQGKAEKAVELTRSAAEMEKTVEKHPVTPGALLPPYEALGNLLMELDRPAEAFEAYKASDEIWPERYKTLLGAARAAKAAGIEQSANEYYQRLLESSGNTDRKSWQEAQQFVAK
jgi:tetratricopeptide (TPR) repeat protein